MKTKPSSKSTTPAHTAVANATPSGDPVLVVGSGVHAYAGQTVIDWSGLLADLASGQTQPFPLRTSAPALAWEGRLIEESAKVKKKAAARSEAKQLNDLATRLDETYPSTELTPELLRLHSADIADLVIFNFDRGLHEGRKKSEWEAPREGPPIGQTRTWYPHGHTGKPNKIVFGARRYGTEIAELESARGSYWDRLRSADARGREAPSPEHWLHVFLADRSVTLIGLGMSPDEWTLWWALTQRARRFARSTRDERPNTTVFAYSKTAGARPPHAAWLDDATRALGIELEWFTRKESKSVWDRAISQSARSSPRKCTK